MTPSFVPMMPLAPISARIASVSIHSARKSSALMVMIFDSWWKVFLGKLCRCLAKSARVRIPRSPGDVGFGGT